MAMALAAPAARAVSTWVVRQSPAVIDVVAKEVSSRSGVAIRTGKALIEFAKSAPAKAALVVASAASLGYDVYSAVADAIGGAEKVADLASDWKSQTAPLLDKEANLALNLGSPQDVQMAMEVVRYFKQVFGLSKPADLAQLHLMIGALHEMSTGQVRYIAETFWNARPVR